MEKIRLKSVYFKQLKGLNDVRISFEKPLTAIMGVNGSGKTTVIHALACIYQPDNKGENHRFPEFFVPNTDALWTGSEMHVINEYKDKAGQWLASNSRKYEKAFDRWAPRYDSRPKRDVFYIGIDTCLPEIEKNTPQSKIQYSSTLRDDDLSQKITSMAAYILNKDYTSLMDNLYHKKHFSGVSLSTGLKYSSLSMGTGEQRTIKILEKVLSAEPYSLILIDEIDLLLHISALNRLIEKLFEIAKSRNLQIVFTTHALQMSKLSKFVSVQYIDNIKLQDGSLKTISYGEISSDLIYNITGEKTQPLQIFVEDVFAKTIIKRIARNLKISSKINVVTYGSIENSFTLASAQVLSNTDVSNTLIVLDGDRYISREEKMAQIKKRLTGTESDIEEKRETALKLISQFLLPDNVSPEKFLRDLLIECGDIESELVATALETYSVDDTHQWLGNIRIKLNDSEENIVRDIIDIVWNSEKWNTYIEPVIEWLYERRNI